MLVGCPAWNDSMSTQRFDLPTGIAKREAVASHLGFPRRPGDGACSFRPIPAMPAASSVLTHPMPWGSSRCVKRSLEWGDNGDEPLHASRPKRSRIEDDGYVVCGGGDRDTGAGDRGAHLLLPRAEEKVFLVPNAAYFPTTAAASSSTSYVPKKESSSPSGSESSTDTGSSQQEREKTQSIGEHGEDSALAERQGLELVGLLTACAESIASFNHEATGFFLERLGEQASPTSTPVHRMAAYFTEAFALRAAKMWPLVFDISPPRGTVDTPIDEEAAAFRVLNAVTAIPKFLHFTMNARLLRAFEGEERVHVIDFDIKQGLQWPSFFQSLASQPRPPSHVRITGVGDSRQELLDTGAMLSRFADASGLAFEFHAVVDRLEDVRLWMLHVTRDECVGVNCISVMHKLLTDETGVALTDFLNLIKSTNPRILVVGEQEAEHNTGRWEARATRAMQYYAAMFDAIDAGRLHRSSAARIKAEEMLGREIRDIVAYDGGDRVERYEEFEQWRRLIEARGMRSAGIGEREAMQGRMIGQMFAPARYGIEERRRCGGADGGRRCDGLTLKWRERALFTVSAWIMKILEKIGPRRTKNGGKNRNCFLFSILL